MATFLAQLRAGQHVMLVHQDGFAIEPLIGQLRSMSPTGELRIVDE